MASLNFYLVDMIAHFRGTKDPNYEWWGKVVANLRKHMAPVVEKSSKFDSIDIWWCPEGSPSTNDVDIVVYVTTNVKNTIIGNNGGSAGLAEADENLLGLTATGLNICEVYLDREPYQNPKVIAGAAFHEAAHVKSRQGNEMHSGKDGFLTAKPDYYGSPSPNNISYFAGIIGNVAKQNGALKPKNF